MVVFPLFARAADERLENYITIRTEQFGIDEDKFVSLLECESGFSHFLQNGKLVGGDYENGKPTSFGILQFKKATFEKYAKLYGYKNDIANPFFQIDLALFMLQLDDNRFHWKNCSNKNKIVTYLKPRLKMTLAIR